MLRESSIELQEYLWMVRPNRYSLIPAISVTTAQGLAIHAANSAVSCAGPDNPISGRFPPTFGTDLNGG